MMGDGFMKTNDHFSLRKVYFSDEREVLGIRGKVNGIRDKISAKPLALWVPDRDAVSGSQA